MLIVLGWLAGASRAGALGEGWCRLRGVTGCGVEQLLWTQAQSLDRGVDPGPLFIQKLLTFTFEQKIMRPVFDEHSKASPFLDQLLIRQFLVRFEPSERGGRM